MFSDKHLKLIRMTNLFECRVKYGKINDLGNAVNVSEVYIVDAMSYTEAETRIHEEMGQIVSGTFEVKRITPGNYSRLLLDEAANADKFFKVKTILFAIDDVTGKEKRIVEYSLVQASDIVHALESEFVSNEGLALRWEVVSITETAILEVFESDFDDDVNAYKVPNPENMCTD